MWWPRYSAAHSEEGEGAPAGMLEAPAPTPLLASRSPERPSQERRALLPKVCASLLWTYVCIWYPVSIHGVSSTWCWALHIQGSQSGRGAQSTSRALRPGTPQIGIMCYSAAQRAKPSVLSPAHLQLLVYNAITCKTRVPRMAGADMDTQQKEMQRPERQPPLRDAKKGGKGFGSRAASGRVLHQCWSSTVPNCLGISASGVA